MKFRQTLKDFSSKTLAIILKELQKGSILERQAYHEMGHLPHLVCCNVNCQLLTDPVYQPWMQNLQQTDLVQTH
jgi:hypothetical protein